MNINTYKPHWKRRITRQREREKAKCILDKLCEITAIFYVIGLFAWIFLDAFDWFIF